MGGGGFGGSREADPEVEALNGGMTAYRLVLVDGRAATVLDLSGDRRPTADLVALTEVLSGRRVVVEARGEIFTIPAEKGDIRNLTNSSGSAEREPAWSPDGKWIAYTSTRHGNQELYIARPDGKDEKRLTSDPATDAHPAWSPDSKHIAFASDRWGDLEIAMLEVESGKVTRLTTSRGLDDYPAWSPDGKRIAFTSNRERNLEVYVMDADGKNVRQLTKAPGCYNGGPFFSPDGTKVIFRSDRKKKDHLQLFVINVDGTGERALTDNDDWVHCRVCGRAKRRTGAR